MKASYKMSLHKYEDYTDTPTIFELTQVRLPYTCTSRIITRLRQLPPGTISRYYAIYYR